MSDWIPALSTTSLFATVLWLSRNLILTRLKASVTHEYNEKLAIVNAIIRENEEFLKAELKSKESEIEALRNNALSNVQNRQNVLFQRQLEAIEKVWESLVLLAPAKMLSATHAIINYEPAAKQAANDPNAREMFAMLANIDMEQLAEPLSQAYKERPFLSPLSWAYYSAHKAILTHAVARMHMLKNGVGDGDYIDNEGVINLVKAALPHRIEYIDEHGVSVLHNLLEELESKLLISFQLTMNGEEADKESLQRAANIIKSAEDLSKENTA